jgi:uncharacterized membrane protein YeiH
VLSDDLETSINLVGIFAFSLSGALMGVRRQFDIVGMAVLATVTALGGGLIRDILINIRPAALHNPSWLLLPLAATLVTFWFHPQLQRMRAAIEVFDAIGLGVFCVTATTLALSYDIQPVAAVFLGTISGVGGGVIRDVLAGATPALFSPTSRLYAVPAVLGAIAIVLIDQVGTVTVGAQYVTAAGVCGLRGLALWRGWTAPVPRVGGLRGRRTANR